MALWRRSAQVHRAARLSKNSRKNAIFPTLRAISTRVMGSLSFD
jgi:hypothetical protein